MVDKPSTTPCDTGCDSAVVERNRYFTGKYMTARDFAGEQEYFLNRNRLHNRLLHGWGIVCGLRVMEHPNEECKKNWVVVKSGVAIDCCGREIFLHQDTALEVPLDDLPSAHDDGGDGGEQSVGVMHSGSEEKHDDEHEHEKPDEDHEPPKPDWPTNGLLVCLRYTEQLIEPVPALYAEGHCEPGHQEANRVREVGVLELRRLDDMDPGCWRMPSGGWDAPCKDDCDEPLPGPGGVCLEPDCPCGGCVPLALLVRKDDCAPYEPGFTIHLNGRRRLPTPSHYLTHIIGINWPHGGKVSLEELEEQMGGALKIRFDRRLQATNGMKTGINPHTFQVQYGGIQKQLEFLPTASEQDPYLCDDDCTAIYNISPDYISYKHRDSIAGSIVYVTLKCDFILDCHELPVDGNHMSGLLPSGDGRPGSNFHSWFRVVHSHKSGGED